MISQTFIGWFYVISAACLLIYVFLFGARLGPAKFLSGKRLAIAWAYLPVLAVAVALGVIMLVMGSECLKGNITLTFP